MASVIMMGFRLEQIKESLREFQEASDGAFLFDNTEHFDREPEEIVYYFSDVKWGWTIKEKLE